MYKVAVLMGTIEQFKSFAFENKNDEFDYIYINKVEDVAGHNFNGMIIDGTFWSRPDATDLHRAVITHIK